MEYIELSKLKKLPNNPRVIKDNQFKTLVKSIQDNPDYFEARPIICSDRTGELIIIAGNQRYEAARSLKLKSAPVHILSGLTEAREQEIIIRDNVSNGSFDWDLLANEWDQEKLIEWGVEIPDFAFKQEAIEDDYEIPDEIETDIVLGDLFEIGQHRLLCGDSNNADDVNKLLGGGKPILMVTDPPYGVNYDPEWRKDSGIGSKDAVCATGKVNNDDSHSWGQAYSLFTGAVCYVWSASWYLPQVGMDLNDNDFNIRALIIWNKNRLIPSRGHYHWKHEPCWYAVKKNKTANWIGDRKQGTVWDIDVVKNETGHGTQKPIECMARPIRNHDGDVYDPFLGSGTTMVAAHQLNRKCYGMEIDPKYCQVIIDRMRKLDPDIVIKKNGVIYTD